MKISEYFNSAKEMAVGGAKIAVQKSKEMASITKANIAIRGEEEKIRKAQLELGKLFYKDYIVGEEPDMAEYLPWCEKISESKISIEDLKIAIEDLKAAGKADDEEVEIEVEVITVEETHGEDCTCGCHDHEEAHEEGCSCGCHDHEEHEESCTCGCHDHEEHEESCTCGCHDHEEAHEEGCSCGCDHDHEEK